MTEDADTAEAPEAAAAGAADAPGPWQERLDRLVEDAGYFERLGARHAALFIDEGPQLLVSFEQGAEVRARPGQMPLAYEVAQGQGWSYLGLFAEGETWWRDRAVYGYFDRLVDDAFFEDFDHVAFYGVGAGGYAAAAFSVAAPGATVLAIRPQATLDPAFAGWDRRFLRHRRLCFTDRYGFAPAMIEGTGRVLIAYDPFETEDAMHAALFRGPHVARLPMPLAGAEPEALLEATGALPEILALLGAGRLDRLALARAWRRRRNHVPYLRRLLGRTTAAGPARTARLARAILALHDLPRFRRVLRAAEEQLGARPPR